MKNIGSEAFCDCSSITHIDFGAGLKTIGYSAFQNCISLEEVVLPDSLDEMYDYNTFSGCTSLKNVVIGDGLKTIPGYCFYNCTSLETIDFGNSVENIEYAAFEGCNKIRKIAFPNSLKNIGSEAFYGCSSITHIDFGAGLKTIGYSAFQNCSSLEEVVLPDSLAEMYDNYTFSGCTSLKNVVIGDGLKTIPAYCFCDCTSLETVVFGKSINSVEYDAFYGCTDLNKVYFLGDAPEINEGNTDFVDENVDWYYIPGDNSFTEDFAIKSSTYKTITINNNGGTSVVGEDTVETYTKYSDFGKLSAPVLPTREGYTFKGWYLNSACTGDEVDFNTFKVTKNLTLYAKWEKNTYRIFFDPRGGSVSLGGKEVVYADAIGTLPTPTLSGDTFEGWYLGMNSSGPQYTATTKMPAKDIVLYAGWTKNDNATTVIFDTQGGNFIAPLSVTAGSKISKPTNPTRANYIFIGWYKDANHNDKFDFSNDVIDANTTIYAHWKHIHSSVTDQAVAPTCTTTGLTEGSHCSICGLTIVHQETVAKTPHTYKNGECTVCGKWQYKNTAVKLGTIKNTTSGVYLSWSKLPGADKYAVYRKTTGGWTKLTTNATGTSFTDKTAKNNVKYTYTVRAINGSEYNTTYNKTGLKVTFMSAPKITSVTNAATGVTVKWGKVSGATVYYVYRKTTGGWTKLGSTKSTSFTDKKAKAGTKYTYTIIAAKSGAKSSYYSGKAIVRLTVPKLTKLTATSKKNTLTYGKVTGATSYIIYRKTGNGGWQKIATTKSTKYVDTKIKKGTYYTYTVRAVRGTSTSYYNTKGLKVRAK